MALEILLALVPAMITFAVFFWGQVTLPRQMEKLEKMIELFHMFKELERLENQACEESITEKPRQRSLRMLVPIQDQIDTVCMIATLGLRKISRMLAWALMGIVVGVVSLRAGIIPKFGCLSWLDNFGGDIASVVVAVVLVAWLVLKYLNCEEKKAVNGAREVDSGLIKYLNQLSQITSTELPPKREL